MTPPPLMAQGRGAMVAALVALALLQAVAAGAAATATRGLFHAMAAADPLPASALSVLAASGVAIALLRIAFRRVGERLGQSYAHAIRTVLFDHASRTAPKDLSARRTGHVSLRFVGDLTALKDWPARGLPMLVEGVVTVPAMILILGWLHPGFGLIGLAVASLSLAGLGLALRGLVGAHRTLRARRAQLAADMAERLPIAPQLAVQGRRGHEMALIRRRAAGLTHAALARITRAEALRALPDALTGAAAAVVIWRGATEGLDTGGIAAGLAVLGLMARPLRGLMGLTDRGGAYRVALGKLRRALGRATLPERTSAGIRLPRGPIALTLSDVVVSGSDRASLALGRGEHAALYARLDAATLYEAVVGLTPPEDGDIRLDGLTPHDLTPGSLRRGIARIDDSPVVLKGSVRRSLTLSLTERPSDATILKRLKKAGLSDLVDMLGGLGRGLSEGARSLSPPERTALSALQAALLRPGLLIVSGQARARVPAVARWLDKNPATVVVVD